MHTRYNIRIIMVYKLQKLFENVIYGVSFIFFIFFNAGIIIIYILYGRRTVAYIRTRNDKSLFIYSVLFYIVHLIFSWWQSIFNP